MYATFYCTHSIGPIVHITGLRPVKVTGFEIPYNKRSESMGKLGATAGIEMITMENGAIVKSIHGDLDKNSIWYSIYGSLGRMESAREDALNKDIETLYLNLDQIEGEYQNKVICYEQSDEHSEVAKGYGHGGSDFYTMFHFVEKIKGSKDSDIIDIYEALDMFLPGMFAYRSILANGIPMDIPDFRKPEVREQYRHDIICTDPKVAGTQVIPCYSKGNPDISDAIYERIKQEWLSHR